MATLSRANTGVLSRGNVIQQNNVLSSPVTEESTNNGGVLGGIGYVSEKLAVGFMSSLEGIWDYSAGGIAKLFGADDWAEEQIATDWFGDWYSHPEEWYNPSKGWQTAGDVASGIGTSLPAIAGVGIGAGIAAASGGTLSPLAAGLISASVATLGAAGNATKEAYRQTGTLDGKAFGYGALSGLTEGALEFATNALTLGTGKIVKSIAGSLGRNLAKTAAKEAAEVGFKSTVKALGGAALGEGFEEAVSTALSPYWKRMTYDPSAENATAEEIGYAAFVGGLSGLFMDGGRIATGTTSSYLKGNALARDGKAPEVLELSDQLSSFQEKNQSDNEAFKFVSDTYKKLSESLKSTGGIVSTVGQKKMLGDLQKANVSAVFTPLVTKSAVNIVANADTIAEKLTAYGMKDASGKTLTFTADQIRAGIDTKNQKTLSKSFAKALESNNVLRTLAVADVTGRLMMDTAKFEQATLMGQKLASQVDINRFYETATSAEINAVSDALGIENWATLTPATFGEKIQTYITNGGTKAYADTKRAKAAFEAIPAESAQKMPSKLNLTADGAVRYADGALSVAIEKKGDSYRIYDYGTGKLTKFVPAETVNGYLSTYRTQVDTAMAQEAARQREAAEVETFARENVREYKNLGDANQGMIRRLIRSGRAAGISDTDLATYAKVSARSGLDIVFDKDATARTDANGNVQYADGYYSASENRIVVNPEGTRSAERLLIHELDHAIRQSHGVTAYRQALEGVSDEVRQSIVRNYAGVADAGNRTALVLDETNARYAEDILSNKHTLERLVATEPTLKERILSFFKGASTDYADSPKLSGAAKKYYRTYKKLFDSFAEGNYQGNAYGNTVKNQTAVKNAMKDMMPATKDFLVENAKTVTEMDLVANLSGKEFSSDGKTSLKDRVVSFFNSFGNQVFNPDLGDVAVTTSSFRDDKGHGLTYNKVVSFSAIPEVLSNGKIIDIWTPEGKPYTRITVAAPISISGEKYYMGVMVQRDNQSQRMYLHDVITEKATLSFTTEPTAQNGEGIRDKGHLFITSILQNALNVNKKSEKTDKKFALPESNSDGDPLTEQQREYFKNSRATDTQGRLLVLYHQTNADFTEFDTNREGAGARDNETPHGIFLKPTDENIGLKGDKQMRLYANITNPLKFYTRADAQWYWKHNIDGYADILSQIAVNDRVYNEQFEEVFDLKRLARRRRNAELSELERKEIDALYEESEAESQKVLDEWKEANTVLDKKAKALIDEYLKDNGYDGIFLLEDQGSFGRKVQTYIALSAEQVKNTDNATPTTSKDIRYALPDNEVTRSIREDEKKRNFNYSEGQEAKAFSNENAKKVYTRKDASRVVSAVMAETMDFGQVYGNLVGKSRDRVVEMLWKALNSAPAGERVGVALKIAEYTIDNAVVEDAIEDPRNEYYRETVSTLQNYIRKLDLSGIRSDIKHKYDTKSAGVFSRWGVRKGKRGISPDVAAMELAELGFQIDATHPADILFEMDDAYRKATQALKSRGRTFLKDGLTDAERKKLQGQIVNSILRGYDTEGSPSKLAKTINEYSERVCKLSGELREEKGRNSLINRALDSVGKLRDIKLGNQHNATEFNDPLFRGSIGKLAGIKYRGNLRDAGTRKIFADFAPWYHAKNQLFETQPDLYQESIAEMISQIANGEGDLTNVELKALTNVVDYFRHLVENYNKVYRKGQWVDAEPIAKSYVNTLQSNNGIKTDLFGKIWGTWYGDLFADPISLARRMDYYESGFYSEMMEELRDAAVDAQITEMELLGEYDKFMKDHPKYIAQAQNQTLNYRAREIPKMQAIGLYMTMKRKHAWAGIALSGITYKDKSGESVRIQGITSDLKITQPEMKLLIAEQQKGLESQFTDADRQYIAILEQVYNHDARKLKESRDIQRLGYTNVADDYYYPIRRGNIAKNVDTSDFASEVDRVSNASFNKDTVTGAKQELFVEDVDAVFRRHVRAVSQYAHLSPALDNYNRLYNMDVSGNKNRPVSVATEGANIWKKGDLYFRKLISDIQGIPTSSGEGMATLAFIRSGYAKFQLGGNPKVWVTQLSSLFAASGMLDTDSIMKGLRVQSKDVQSYCSLAKLRARDNTVAKSQGLIDKVDKASDFFMKPIGFMDQFVVGRLFGACQVQVEKNGGAKVGTKENKNAAGELLRRVILETQQNSIATERSAAMRSSNELLRTVTMFSADSMKVFGRVVDSVGKHYVLKQRLKHTQNAEMRAGIEKQLKTATIQARKSVAALLTSAVFMVAIAEGFRWLYNKEREDENVALTVTLDLIGNLIGGLPLLRDLYSKITDGYDLDNYAYSAANDLLNSTINLFDAVGTVFSGEADSQKIAASIKNSVNAAGQILGIPTRNLYNVTTGLIRRVTPTFAYKIDRVFYKKSYTSDLAKAVEEGDGAMVSTILELALNENLGVFSDDVRTELNALTMSGYNVIPHKVWDRVSVDGEEIPLTETQQAQIQSVYATVSTALTDLVSSASYRGLSDENKAASVKYLYDLYYEKGLLDAGVDRGASILRLMKVIDAADIALLYGKTRGIESDVDRQGKTISGSKRKKVIAAINSLDVSVEKKLLLICAKGYSIQDGDVRGMSAERARTKLLHYILRMPGVSRAEKAEFAEMCGFEVRNGRIIQKNS